jgi:hypothetical protein
LIGIRAAAPLLAALLLFSCARPDDSEESGHRWVGRTITFYLNREANLLSETTIREVFQRWEDTTGIRFIYGGRNGAGLRRDGKSTVSFLARWPNDVPISKVAVCRKWCDRKGNIVEADIALNNQIARFTTLRTNKPDSYYLEGVLSHEIGHMLGLGHTQSDSSLMKPFSPPAESYRMGVIDEATLAAIRSLYGTQ